MFKIVVYEMVSIVPRIKNFKIRPRIKKFKNNINNAVNTNQEQKGSEVSKVSSIPIVNGVSSSSNVPKLEVSKEIKDVIKKEKLSEQKNPTENDDNNGAISKVSAPKAPCPKPSVQEDNTLRRSNRVSKPNKKYLDVASSISNLKFWNSTPTYNTDIQTL